MVGKWCCIGNSPPEIALTKKALVVAMSHENDVRQHQQTSFPKFAIPSVSYGTTVSITKDRVIRATPYRPIIARS